MFVKTDLTVKYGFVFGQAVAEFLYFVLEINAYLFALQFHRDVGIVFYRVAHGESTELFGAINGVEFKLFARLLVIHFGDKREARVEFVNVAVDLIFGTFGENHLRDAFFHREDTLFEGFHYLRGLVVYGNGLQRSESLDYERSKQEAQRLEFFPFSAEDVIFKMLPTFLVKAKIVIRPRADGFLLQKEIYRSVNFGMVADEEYRLVFGGFFGLPYKFVLREKQPYQPSQTTVEGVKRFVLGILFERTVIFFHIAIVA